MNRFQLRRTTTPSNVPTMLDLLVGELGANLVDNKLFLNNGTEVVDLTAAANIAQDANNRFVTDAQIAAWSTPYELPVASASVLGGVKVGANIQVDANGVISLSVADTGTTGLLSAADWNTFNGKQDALGYTPIDRAGDTLEGHLVFPGVPTLANHAATKAYADAGLATKVDLSGGTMSGPLVLSADPVDNLGATTKQYVDAAVSLVSGRLGAPVQALADLSAIGSADRQDKMMRLVEDTGAIFSFDAESELVANGTSVIIPDDTPITGRWIKIQAATQNHEALSGLLGGAAGDHLHLTTAEKNGYDAHIANYDLHLTVEQNTWLDALVATSAEVNFLSGVTSNIQTQIDSKQANLGFTPVNVAGDTMSGPLLMSQDPVAAMEPVTLQFLNNYVIDGGTF